MIPSMNLVKKILRYVEGLRFPWLVLLIAIVFVANVVIPDPLPFIDELLLGLLMVAFGRLRKPRSAIASDDQKPGK